MVGNHEFQRTSQSSPKRLSIQWRPQFTLPIEQSLNPKLHETVYSVNYQDVLIIVLNSTDFLEKQTEYIEDKLSNSNAKWKITQLPNCITKATHVDDRVTVDKTRKVFAVESVQGN